LFARISAVLLIGGLVSIGVDFAGKGSSVMKVASLEGGSAKVETKLSAEVPARISEPEKEKRPAEEAPLPQGSPEGCGREDPFAPLELQRVQAPVQKEGPQFRLNGIVWSEDQPLAIVNDTIVGVGDTIQGAQVVEIKRREVILKYEGKVLSLKFKTLILFRVKERPRYASGKNKRESRRESPEEERARRRLPNDRLESPGAFPLAYPGNLLHGACKMEKPEFPFIEDLSLQWKNSELLLREEIFPDLRQILSASRVMNPFGFDVSTNKDMKRGAPLWKR